MVEAKTIAGNLNIPLRFSLKILRLLAKGGVINSYQGAGGGYALAGSPGKITLRDVVEVIKGPIRINKCLIDPAYCNRHDVAHCSVHDALASIQDVLSRELASHNFQQLTEGFPGSETRN